MTYATTRKLSLIVVPAACFHFYCTSPIRADPDPIQDPCPTLAHRNADESGSDWTTDPVVLLQQLQRRDEKFENHSLQAEQRWTERVSPRGQVAAGGFNAQRFGQRPPPAPAKVEIPADFDQPHRVRYLLTVREPELTLERVGEFEKMKYPRYVAIDNRGHRWTTVGGMERSYSPQTKTLHLHGVPRPASRLRSYQWMFEWCCGYGLAKRMTSIDSIHIQGDQLHVAGRLQLMDNDKSRVEMDLDRDYILRRAILVVPVMHGNGSNRYVVTTRGTSRIDGLPAVAMEGHFQRFLQPANKPARLYEEFDVDFVSVSASLTDEQYQERTQIEAAPGSTSMDLRPKP